MTNSIGYSNQPLPANYSGVTIHVNNPSVTSLPNGCVVNPGQNYQQPIVASAYTTNPYIANPIYAPQYVNPNVEQQVPASQGQSINGQVAQAQFPQGYPPQYYMNNYNYVQGQGTQIPQTIPNNGFVEQQNNNIFSTNETTQI